MDDDDQRRLSLIPYPASGEAQVVLRRGSAVVLYDPRSKAITLRDLTANNIEDEACPYCHRPFQPSHTGDEDDEEPLATPTPAETSFMDPSYFRMLHHSNNPSRQPSRSPSPKRLALPSRLAAAATTAAAAESAQGSPRTATPDQTDSSHRISSDSFSPNYFNTFFVEEAELGRGGNGVVLLVRHYIGGVDLGLFACKRIPVGNDRSWLRKVLVEVQLLQTLSHQNLVSYKHVWLENYKTTNFGPSVPCAFILQQYCNAGDLHHYMFGSDQMMTNEQLKHRARARSKGQLSPPLDLDGHGRHLHFDEIFSFFRDIASGLNYLHRSGYIHRDLKPSNCLLHRTGGHTRCLLSDFGETQGAGVVRESSGNTGTISFCAPEVLTWNENTNSYGNFSEKSDIFSLGLIVHLMCFNRLPYAGADTESGEIEDMEQLRAEIAAWAGWSGVNERKERQDLPEQLYNYLKLLLAIDPNERPGTEQILQGIKGFHEQARPKSSSGSRTHADADARVRPMPGDGDQSSHSLPEIPRRSSAYGQKDGAWSRSQESPVRRNSPNMGSLIQRRRTARSPGDAQRPSTPRLMPPPTPTSRVDNAVSKLSKPEVLATAKVFLLAMKIWWLTSPCTPFAVKPLIFYSLLGLAAMDLFGRYKSFASTIAFALAHFVAVFVARRFDVLCLLDPSIDMI